VFNPLLAIGTDSYVATQVDSGAGMFGHSELFIEHWDRIRNRVNTFKVHLQTLGQTRIDIVPINGAVDMTRIGSRRSYRINDRQFDAIMQAAIIIKNKMEQGYITFAEIFPDRNPQWMNAGPNLRVEMSCKSFTDALLIEAGLRQEYGGFLFSAFLNAPSFV
jgi:hypothetical protein